MLGIYNRKADPLRSHNAGELAVREKRDAAIRRANPGNQPFGPGGDLIRHFAIWAAVTKNAPARPNLANVPGKLTLIVAVSPLRQVRLDLRRGPEPGQLAGSPGALQRTG